MPCAQPADGGDQIGPLVLHAGDLLVQFRGFGLRQKVDRPHVLALAHQLFQLRFDLVRIGPGFGRRQVGQRRRLLRRAFQPFRDPLANGVQRLARGGHGGFRADAGFARVAQVRFGLTQALFRGGELGFGFLQGVGGALPRPLRVGDAVQQVGALGLDLVRAAGEFFQLRLGGFGALHQLGKPFVGSGGTVGPAALFGLDSAKALTPPLGFAEQAVQGVLPPGQLAAPFRQIGPKLGDALARFSRFRQRFQSGAGLRDLGFGLAPVGFQPFHGFGQRREARCGRGGGLGQLGVMIAGAGNGAEGVAYRVAAAALLGCGFRRLARGRLRTPRALRRRCPRRRPVPAGVPPAGCAASGGSRRRSERRPRRTTRPSATKRRRG